MKTIPIIIFLVLLSFTGTLAQQRRSDQTTSSSETATGAERLPQTSEIPVSTEPKIDPNIDDAIKICERVRRCNNFLIYLRKKLLLNQENSVPEQRYFNPSNQRFTPRYWRRRN